MTAAPHQVLAELVERVYRHRDTTALDAAVAAGARPSWHEVLGLLAGFPGATLNTDDVVVDGDRVAVRLTLRGVHLAPAAGQAATGHLVELAIFGVYRLAGGLVTQAWQHWDGAALADQLGPAGVVEPVVDLSEIQGNVFPGFAKDHVALLSLELVDPDAARGWFGARAAEVATAAEVLAFGELFTATRSRRGREGTVGAAWHNVALAHRALRALLPQADQLDDAAFRAGIRGRVAGTGGWPAGEPDVLVVVAADTRSALNAEVRRLREGLGGGLRLRGRQLGATLPGERSGHEHFGFRDGISQPGLRGRAGAAPYRPLTERRTPGRPDRGLPGQTLVWPGEFVLGYPAQHPADPHRPGPVSAAGAPWARNGSYLVYGRYRQDVPAFRRFVAAAAGRLAAAEPALAGLDAEHLAALLIGRWAGGAPLVPAPSRDDPTLATSNDFDYRGDDPLGLACPPAAHIRRSYPRDERPAAEVQRHRILRRGIPFGDPDGDGERGLLFLSYQASIERQFEFLLTHWLAADPVLGSSGPPRPFGIPVIGGSDVELDLGEPWTELTAGGYFFTPSVSLLDLISHLP